MKMAVRPDRGRRAWLRLPPPRVALLVVGALAGAPVAAQVGPAPVIAVENGRWYNGRGFEAGTFYIRDGVLRRERPARVDSVLDLGGRYVIPPLGDAHTHNLDGEYGLDAVRDAYVSEGTLYVQVLTNTTTGAAKVKPRFGDVCSIDVVYANGGLTSTLSHPFMAYEPRAMGIFSDYAAHADRIRASRKRENDAYWFIDSREDLADKWPLIRATDPGIIKIFLLGAVEGPPDIGETGVPHGYGLRPSLVPEIVRRAGEAGLRVAAHVETAADFAVAVRGGVRILAHMPGYLYGMAPDGSIDPSAPMEPFEISDEVAREAGERGVLVTPTVSRTYVASGPDSAAVVARRQELMRRNVATLRGNGVRFIVGSDAYGRTGWHEMDAMRALGVWADEELLRTWVEETPRSIFPGRRLGRLEAGYEASFLALEEDPTRSVDALRHIALRVKQGCVLEAP
ncbi:MAG TPA: amidohydrolase family protein [Longimicrobiales bacterium]|jgi:imidazolonepropionase-like amidohydrolase